jgi:hypothetical protein
MLLMRVPVRVLRVYNRKAKYQAGTRAKHDVNEGIGLSRKWKPSERYLGWYSGRYHGELDGPVAGVRLAASSQGPAP